MERTISTERIILREYSPSTGRRIFESLPDNEIMHYFGLKTEQELHLEKERYRQGLEMFGLSFRYFYLLEKESRQVMGWCGFHRWYTRHDRGELGYVLQDDVYKGKGYMKEALPVIIEYGFNEMLLHRIEAFVSYDNIPSLKLLKHFGFIEEGNLREHYLTNGRHEDSLIYSLLKK